MSNENVDIFVGTVIGELLIAGAPGVTVSLDVDHHAMKFAVGESSCLIDASMLGKLTHPRSAALQFIRPIVERMTPPISFDEKISRFAHRIGLK